MERITYPQSHPKDMARLRVVVTYPHHIYGADTIDVKVATSKIK